MRGNQIILATVTGLLAGSVGAVLQVDTAKAASPKTVVNVAFKPTNETDLTNYVYNTVDPTSGDFHHYLTPSEFAAKFGQSASYVQSFEEYLKPYHVSAYVYPGNLAMKVEGSKTNLRKAFKAKFTQPHKNQTPVTKYTLPGNLSDKVVAVIGLYTEKPANKKSKATKKATAHQKAALMTRYDADVPNSDQKPDTSLPSNAFSEKFGADKFTSSYNLTPLLNKVLQGQGQRIGIISGSDVKDSDLTTYWNQVGVDTNLNQIHRIYTADDQANVEKVLKLGLTPTQIESTLDVQSATAVAPKADIDLYIGESIDTTTSTSAQYGAFMQAIADNVDKQLTSSFSSSIEMAAYWNDQSATMMQYNEAFNLMLEQAAAQGITVFRASGDNGPWIKSTAKENHMASTSPYQVMVGGTTLPYQKIIDSKLITVPKERAWGDTHSGKASDGEFPGSGGGFSALNPTPRYQQGVSGVNTFRAENFLNFKNGKHTINPHPHLIFGTGNSRNLPDVSGNADPQTGYATYVSGDRVSVKGEKIIRKPMKIWMVSGGTSYTSPQMAAANAVINSGRQTPVGFWNPQIYKFAQESDSPFTVLDDADNNNNLYYTGQPGKLYNQATGLGTIDSDQLAAKFASED